MFKIHLIFSIMAVFILFFPLVILAQDYQWVALANHIHSNVSSGSYSLEQIVKMAKEKSIKVLIITDTALKRWEYGLWPWPNIIKRTIEDKSVIKFGPKNYLSQIAQLNQINNEVLIIPGAEVAPFYYWQGNFFKNNLTLRNWHKHTLVIGLNQPEDYYHLPLLSNNFRGVYSLKSMLKLWPLLFIILGLWLYIFKKRIKLSFYIIIISLFFLLRSFPFTDLGFDQYHGDQGPRPYQRLINYINGKGGLIFWAHPESPYEARVGKINIFTPAYCNDLVNTFYYIGFCSLYWNHIEITEPKREWDSILKQYCAGRRKAPVWNISELDFCDINNKIDKNQTFLFLKELNTASVIEAIRKGHMYSRLNLNDHPDALEEFWLKDSLTNRKSYMGEEIASTGKVILKIKGKTILPDAELATIEIIRQGELIKNIDVSNGEFDVTFEDSYSGPDKLIYYRIRITSPNSIIICNPIFVRWL